MAKHIPAWTGFGRNRPNLLHSSWNVLVNKTPFQLLKTTRFVQPWRACYSTGPMDKAACLTIKQEKRPIILKKLYGTRSNKPLSNQHTANQFVRWLLPEERSSLFAALKEFQVEEGTLGPPDGTEDDPTFQQLKLVMACNAIPFIGFGFLDNCIMILAGEYIDHTIGITLGISTMAAAAVGNLISDLMGLGLAGYIEAVAVRLGFEVPPMSTRQASMWKTKYSAYFGRGIGITIGCILGMFPLFFIDAVEEEAKDHLLEGDEQTSST